AGWSAPSGSILRCRCWHSDPPAACRFSRAEGLVLHCGETGMRTRLESVPALLDRQLERTALEELLDDVRSGHGRALVLRGEAGVGKTALLEYTVNAAADMRVARAAGVESEMELAFAGLHLLFMPLLDQLESLPGPQRDALE